MTKKEINNITINICRTAEFLAHYQEVDKEKANMLNTQLLAKINLAGSLGINFNCYNLILNDNDIKYNPVYKTFTPGRYVEIVRDDGFRHLAPVRKAED